jgi:hypothetical protein
MKKKARKKETIEIRILDNDDPDNQRIMESYSLRRGNGSAGIMASMMIHCDA